MDRLETHFQEVVLPTWNFSGRLESQKDHELNAFVGLASEAGETLDILKKKWFHSEKPADFFKEKIRLELGDIVYYLLMAMHLTGLTMEEVLEGNRLKLESRHPELNKVTSRYDGNHIH